MHFREGGPGTVFTEEAFYEPPTDLPDWKKGYGNMSANYTYGTQGVEVEVDEDTGEIKILKMVFALDVGKVLNPRPSRVRSTAASPRASATRSTRRSRPSEGRILNPGFTDYKIPTATEMASRSSSRSSRRTTPSGPFGAKGVGEPGLVPTAPAIANAIHDAVGVRVNDLPITPEKVLAALKEKARSDAALSTPEGSRPGPPAHTAK